jgi:hypothetical protein
MDVRIGKAVPILMMLALSGTVSAQKVDDALLSAIARVLPPGGNAQTADRVLDALTAANELDNPLFLYYRAVCLNAKHDMVNALKVADAAIASGFQPTLHEAKTLARQLRWDLTPSEPGANAPEKVMERIDASFDSVWLF